MRSRVEAFATAWTIPELGADRRTPAIRPVAARPRECELPACGRVRPKRKQPHLVKVGIRLSLPQPTNRVHELLYPLEVFFELNRQQTHRRGIVGIATRQVHQVLNFSLRPLEGQRLRIQIVPVHSAHLRGNGGVPTKNLRLPTNGYPRCVAASNAARVMPAPPTTSRLSQMNRRGSRCRLRGDASPRRGSASSR
jgi:hypothetical protein